MNELSNLPGVRVEVRQPTLNFKEYRYFSGSQYLGKQSVYTEHPGRYKVENFRSDGTLSGGYFVTDQTITSFGSNRQILFSESNPNYTSPESVIRPGPIKFPEYSALPNPISAGIDTSGAMADANELARLRRVSGTVGNVANGVSIGGAFGAGDAGGVVTESTVSVTRIRVRSCLLPKTIHARYIFYSFLRNQYAGSGRFLLETLLLGGS